MALETVRPSAELLTRKLGLSDHLSIVEKAWSDELGAMGKWAQVVALHKAMLVVEAESSAVLQELSLRRKELLRRLNKHFPTAWITHLSIRMARND